MITYLYWALIFAAAMLAMGVIGAKFDNWRAGTIIATVLLLTGWAAYFFYFEQVFVKRWGGVMSITVPDGHYHIGATWKDDNLWIQNFDPQTNTCTFSEYSRGNVLQGTVSIKNCNPLLPTQTP